MFDAYAAPESEAELAEIPAVVRGAQAMLLVFGAMYFVLGGLLGAVYGGLGFLDPEMPVVVGVGMGVFMFACSGGFGALMLASAVGLQMRARWAWVGALIVGGMFAGSACMPFGLFLLYAMLIEETRKVYLGPSKAG
jgi:hypothetical protein